VWDPTPVKGNPSTLFGGVHSIEMSEIRLHDTAPAAPGDLELVQRFMNLHEHLPGQESDLPPSRETVERFLRERGLLGEEEPFTEADRAAAIELSDALHAKVRANHG
jgi:hypothetical protein